MRRFPIVRAEEGQAMVEYAVILAMIAAVLIAVLATLGGQIVAALQSVLNAL